MCLVLAERCFVSCSLIIWSSLMLCSTTADLSVHASCICLLRSFDSDLDKSAALSNINLAAFTWDAAYTRRS